MKTELPSASPGAETSIDNEARSPVPCYVAVSHSEQRNPEGLAPSAYAMIISTVGGEERQIWGRGGAKTPESMYAHAVIRLAEKVHLSDPEGEYLELIAPTTNFLKYIKSHTLKWFRAEENGRDISAKDNAKGWKEATVLFNLFDGRARTPANDLERAKVEQAASLARRMAREAEENKEFDRPGVTRTDEDN